MNEVTQLLDAVVRGEARAADRLLPLVYDELRRLAADKLAREDPGQTLQPTALVHEAYLRLVDADKGREWNGRTHFFAAAAEAMRRILVDHARAKKSQKRGGGRGRAAVRGRPRPAARSSPGFGRPRPEPREREPGPPKGGPPPKTPGRAAPRPRPASPSRGASGSAGPPAPKGNTQAGPRDSHEKSWR